MNIMSQETELICFSCNRGVTISQRLWAKWRSKVRFCPLCGFEIATATQELVTKNGWEDAE